MPDFQYAIHSLISRAVRVATRPSNPGVAVASSSTRPGAKQPIPLDPDTGFPAETEDDGQGTIFLAGMAVGSKPVG